MPLNPVPNFPTSLDSLPDPTSTTYTDDDGFELDLLLQKHNAILEAIEAILGAGITSSLGVMRKIAQVSGTGASGVLEFSSIPATYRSLMLHITGRSDTAATSTGIRVTFETTPTAGAYDYQLLSVNNTTVAGSESIAAVDNISGGSVPGASSSANLYGSSSIILPEYANTGMFKTAIATAFGAHDLSSGNLIFRFVGGVWESTAAIDRIRLTLAAGNWTANSRATLWGLPT